VNAFKKFLKLVFFYAVLLAVFAYTTFVLLMKNNLGEDTVEKLFSPENIKGTIISAVIFGALIWLFTNAYKAGKKLDNEKSNKNNT